jgi:uncharacterized damage-inducible protein DinB
MTEKDILVRNHQRESATTLNLLKALPADQYGLKPHEKARAAGELAFVLANQELFYKQAAAGAIDFSLFANQPPATIEGVIARFEENVKAVNDSLASSSVEDLNQIMNFAGHDMRRIDAMWANMFDLVHHRGQFSVYVRMSGAKVPSIYGPTADFPGI